jgi:hypothetical protein
VTSRTIEIYKPLSQTDMLYWRCVCFSCKKNKTNVIIFNNIYKQLVFTSVSAIENNTDTVFIWYNSMCLWYEKLSDSSECRYVYVL